MPKIAIATVDEGAVIADGGGVETRAVVTGSGQPLHLHEHRLQPGASLRLAGIDADRWLYLWKGSVTSAGRDLGPRSSIGVQAGAAFAAVGGPAGGVLLEFRAAAARPVRPAAEVHILPGETVPHLDQAGGSDVRIALHADGESAGCPLWLHEVDYGADGVEKLHSHSADEIIFVRAGALNFGTRVCGPGSALAIPGGAQYSFAAGPDGMSFVNFRGHQSTYRPAGAEDDLPEITMWRQAVARPAYLTPA
jgi:hypothetical protein